LPKNKGSKLKSFKVINNTIIALYENALVFYEMEL
jgi:hypothetical protein